MVSWLQKYVSVCHSLFPEKGDEICWMVRKASRLCRHTGRRALGMLVYGDIPSYKSPYYSETGNRENFIVSLPDTDSGPVSLRSQTTLKQTCICVGALD